MSDEIKQSIRDRWDGNVVDIEQARGEQRANGALVLRAARLPPPESIPVRQWLYGTQLIRGSVTVLVAPGGTGKSAYAMAVAIAVACNRGFLGDHVFAQTAVCIINLDDPMDELDRRVAAIMATHGIEREALLDRLYLEDCDGHRLIMAAPGMDETGAPVVISPDKEALIGEIRGKSIGLLVVDPFAESHELEENSNPQMIRAAAVWREIARTTNCAVLLVHHVRKGEITGIDAARGAKAVTDSARVGLLMSPMSETEAEQWGIDAEDERFGYIRVDDAKRNMAPASKAKWFRLSQVNLGNGTEAYPKGDNVAAIRSWQPPVDGLKVAGAVELNRVLDAIAAGPGDGLRYTETRAGRSGAHWCGAVLLRMMSTTEAAAKRQINQWLQSGLLYVTDYRHPFQRKMTPGVFVNDTLRPS